MLEKKTYSISELAARAGVSVRTIRYYIEEGLLPAPGVMGKYSFYDKETLERLELIRYLKDAYLPLQEIRERLQEMSDEQVRETLVAYRIRQIPDLESQEAILNRFDESGVTQINAYRMIPDETVRPSPKETTDASVYIARVLNEHAASRQARNEVPAPSPIMMDSMKMKYNIGNLQSQVTIPQDDTTWQRIELAPGLELHVRQAVYTSRASAIRRLIEYTRRLFGKTAA